MLSSPWGRFLVSFEQIGQPPFFSRWYLCCDLAHLLQAALLQGGWRYGPIIFRGCCSHHGACPLWVSSRLAKLHFSAGAPWCDLAHLFQAVLLQGGWRYGPAIFRGCCSHHGAGPLWVLSRLAKLHFQPAARDMIWHIYSGQHCFKGVEGMDLPSLGDVALTICRSPVSFKQISQPSFFRGIWDKGPGSAPPPGLKGWCLDGGSWRELAHLLWAALLKGGRRYPLPIFVAHLPTTWGRSPVIFEKIGHCSFFRGISDKGSSSTAPPGLQGWCTAGSSGHDLAHLLLVVLLHGGQCHPLAVFRGGAPWSGEGALWVWQRSNEVLR